MNFLRRTWPSSDSLRSLRVSFFPFWKKLCGGRRAAAKTREEERKERAYGRPRVYISGEEVESAREAVCRKLDHQEIGSLPCRSLNSRFPDLKTNLKSGQPNKQVKTKILLWEKEIMFSFFIFYIFHAETNRRRRNSVPR